MVRFSGKDIAAIRLLGGLALLALIGFGGWDQSLERSVVTGLAKIRSAVAGEEFGPDGPAMIVMNSSDLATPLQSRMAVRLLLDVFRDVEVSERPSVIGVDVLLALADCESCGGMEQESQLIIEATRELGNVVHAASMVPGAKALPVDSRLAPALENIGSRLPPSPSPPLPPYVVADQSLLPHPSFGAALVEASAALGLIQVLPEPEPGEVLWKMVSTVAWPDGRDSRPRFFHTLGLELAAQHMGSEATQIWANGDLPLDDEGALWINWRDRFNTGRLAEEAPSLGRPCNPSVLRVPPPHASLDVVAFHPCARGGGQFMAPGIDFPIPPEVFAGRPVLLVEADEPRAVRVPFGDGQAYLQSAAHAMVADMILRQDYLWVAPAWMPWLVALLLLMVSALVPAYELLPGERVGAGRTLLLLGPEPPIVLAGSIVAGIAFTENLYLSPILPAAGLVGSALGYRALLPLGHRWVVRRYREMEVRHLLVQGSLESKTHQVNALLMKLRGSRALKEPKEVLEDGALSTAATAEGGLLLGEAEATGPRADTFDHEAEPSTEAARLNLHHDALQSLGERQQVLDQKMGAVDDFQASLRPRADELEKHISALNSELSTLSREAASRVGNPSEAGVLQAMTEQACALQVELTEAYRERQDIQQKAEFLEGERQRLADDVDKLRQEKLEILRTMDSYDRVVEQALACLEHAERQPTHVPEAQQELLRELKGAMGELRGLLSEERASRTTLNETHAGVKRRELTMNSNLERRKTLLDRLGHALNRVRVGRQSGGPSSDLSSLLGSKADRYLASEGVFIADERMASVVRQLFEIAKDSDDPMMFTGETGTGKTHLARCLHEVSRRSGQKFESVNCANLLESLADSQLFGYEKGAHNTAEEAKEGLFSKADKGTLFLDELAELKLDVQAKLLKAVDEKTIRPLAGDDKRVDVRVICATLEPIRTLIEEKRLRRDLYIRLAPMGVLTLSPLRERPKDIVLLFRLFLKEASTPSPPPTVTDEAWQLLLGHHWPFNVRSIQNIANYCADVANRLSRDVDGEVVKNAFRIDNFEFPPPLELVSSDWDLDPDEMELLAALRRHAFVQGEVAVELNTSKDDISRRLFLLFCRQLVSQDSPRIRALVGTIAGRESQGDLPYVAVQFCVRQLKRLLTTSDDGSLDKLGRDVAEAASHAAELLRPEIARYEREELSGRSTEHAYIIRRDVTVAQIGWCIGYEVNVGSNERKKLKLVEKLYDAIK